MVGFDVELEMGQQIVFAQEIQAGGGVGIVLMLGRLLGLWLDVELAFEADLLFVIHRQMQQFGEVLQFALHVGVQQRHVAFAAAPEHVAFAAQFVRDFHGLLDLRGGKGKDLGVAAGARAVHVTGIGKQVRGAPEQFDARALLLLLQDLATASRFLLVSARRLPSGATSRSWKQ